MRKISKKHGKFYVEETTIVAEVTVKGLERELTELKEQKKTMLERKEAVLTQRALEHDEKIAQVEKDLESLKELKRGGKTSTTPDRKSATRKAK